MAEFTPRYTRWQREAIAEAYVPWNISAKRVAELAAAGELQHPSGARLGAFDAPESTVRSIARRARAKQSAAQAALKFAAMEPRNAVEEMRQQLGDVIEAEFDRLEIEQSEDRPVSWEAIRQMARAIREFSCIPGPREPLSPAPGAKVNGVRDGSETRGGLAGKVLAACQQHQAA